MALQLLVGLGNPGPQYVQTRHNVGVWWVEAIADYFKVSWRQENKFLSRVAQIKCNNQICWLIIPNTYMNLSGQAVSAMIRFYKFSTESILVAHDDLSFLPGIIRFKESGGHGGHNGLRSIINYLHNSNFSRIRIGIGHPGHKDQVADYVLSRPNESDRLKIVQGIDKTTAIIGDLIAGDFQTVFRELHQEN